jgi:hypothetical protein
MADLAAYALGGSAYSILADSFTHSFGTEDVEDRGRASVLLLIALYLGMTFVGLPSVLLVGARPRWSPPQVRLFLLSS